MGASAGGAVGHLLQDPLRQTMSDGELPLTPDGSADAPSTGEPPAPLPTPKPGDIERRAALDALTRLGQRLGL